jgi:PKD repeat protein
MVRSLALPRPRALVLALAMTLFAALPAATASADIGTQNFSYGSAIGGSPSGEKPESKLWYHDGLWWGALYNPSAGGWRIHRLNGATGQWTATSTALDSRVKTRADVLMDEAANKLYVASSVFTTNGSAQSAGNSARVYRYSYNAGTDSYSLDSGFPVTINGFRSETIVIDKDSTGRLWATWTAGSRVYVTHTTTSDTQWAAPYIIPGAPNLTSDDISSLVHFGGNKIGVMYSNQASSDRKFRFAVHTDGTGDTAASWSTQVVPISWRADDHINLKADSSGRVFAAIKTSESSSSQPLNVLLRRNADGSWSNAVFGTGRDSHTRPIVLLDEPNREVRMYATCPQPPSGSGQSGGDICQKISSMDDLSFPSGIGTTVIQDTGNPEMNDVTSTKQPINAFSGIVLLANDPSTTDTYWTRVLSLGTTPPPPPPGVTANFTASPVSGTAPLNVQFTDTSTGGPTSWSWNFGDGTTSTAQNPAKTYSTPGTYTVTLTASNATSSNTATKTNLITVTDDTPPPPPPPGGTFTAVADAQVKSTSANTNYGTLNSLRLRQGTSASDVFYWSYLRFTVTGLSGPVSGAKLRLYSTDGGPDGGSVYAVADTWSESTLTWNNRPLLGGSPVGTAGIAPTNGFVEINLGNAITGNGTYSFAIATSSSNSVIYDSREGTNKPQLVLPGG